MKCDVAIIGGGIIGLAIARELLEKEPRMKVVVLEKEMHLGTHASGRNSGVIHSGFYYSPSSLKAKFCSEGNLALKNLCQKKNIPVRETGKVVVAKNESEVKVLHTLLDRAKNNGVPLELHSSKYLHEFEPLAVTHKYFLWSPTTAVTDPLLVMEAMAQEVAERGGDILLGEEVLVSPDGEISCGDKKIQAKHVINAAGNQSDRLAHQFGVGEEYSILPFIGLYRSTIEKNLPLKTLVYPVPHPLNPFLGVHFTLTTKGKVKVGPTSIPVLGREQYSFFESWNARDVNRILKTGYKFMLGNPKNFFDLVNSEFPKFQTRNLVQGASLLVPTAASISKWENMPAGIRSQLFHKPSRTLEQDFVVHRGPSSTHILNAVSPGWTSSIPFAKWVVSEYVLDSLN
jgi:L-2-hydroxyglutarate oxidase LhgO